MRAFGQTENQATREIVRRQTQGRSASIHIRGIEGGTLAPEVVIGACAANWTEVDAGNMVVAADATYFKSGAASEKFHIEAAFTTGAVAYQATESAAINMVTGGWTHIAFSVRSSVARAAGDFQIGLDNSATFNTAYAADRFVDIPAVPVIDTWYRMTKALTAAQKALTSVDSVGLWAIVDPGHTDLWIDDITLLRLETFGAVQEGVSAGIVEASVLGNDNADCRRYIELEAPYESRLVEIGRAPCDLLVIGYDAEGSQQDGVPVVVDFGFCGERHWKRGLVRRAEGDLLGVGDELWLGVGE